MVFKQNSRNFAQMEYYLLQHLYSTVITNMVFLVHREARSRIGKEERHDAA